MNDRISKTCNNEKLSDKFQIDWKKIDWEKAEKYVNRLQFRIVKAVEKGDINLVKRLQHLLINSFYAKALAVKKVTTNKGKKTAGIDGEIWKSNEEKENAIKKLNTKGYRAKPTKRVYIPKSNGKQRPLSIPTMTDRAMQTLHLMSLQPIEETLGDKRSFGFRLNRGCHDALEQIFTTLAKKNSAEWILEGDIKGCFDNISHEWIKENVPMNKLCLEQFIKAGYIYNKKLFPNNKGAAQGGAISPTIANITLDGIEKILHEKINIGKSGNPIKKGIHKVNFIRYADDFIVTGESKEILEQAKIIIKDFLKIRGLKLSDEKTLITNIHDGFDFLGWNFRKYNNNKLIIKPSKKSIKKFLNKIRETVKQYSMAKQEVLIVKLNQIIIGWTNYHQPVCAKETFNKIDHIIFQILQKWAYKRHINKGKKWVCRKYWKAEGNRLWVFKTEKYSLRKCSDTPIVRHTKLKINKNPYLDIEYFRERKIKQKERKKRAYMKTVAFKLRSEQNNLKVIEA